METPECMSLYFFFFLSFDLPRSSDPLEGLGDGDDLLWVEVEEDVGFEVGVEGGRAGAEPREDELAVVVLDLKKKKKDLKLM